MSDFVGRLLREPGPRLRPLLPNVFDAAAPRLQTDGEPVPSEFMERRPPAPAIQEPRASALSAPGPGPHLRPEPATEPRPAQEPQPRTASEAEQGPQAATAAGATPGRPLSQAASRTTDVSEALPGPGTHIDPPWADIAPRRGLAPQPDTGLTLDIEPGPGAEPRPRFPLAPEAAIESGSDAPPGPSATLAPGIPTRPTTPLASDTPTRPTEPPGAATTPDAADTGDRMVVTELKNRSSPTPKRTSVDGLQGRDGSHFVVRAGARVAHTQEVAASAQSDGPAHGDERVSPPATDTPEVDLPVPSGPPFAPAAQPGSTGDGAHTSHSVRPAVTPLAATAPPREWRAPGTPKAAEPVVRITIDRLEVRAAPPPAAPPRSAPRRPQLSLDEYLRGRS